MRLGVVVALISCAGQPATEHAVPPELVCAGPVGDIGPMTFDLATSATIEYDAPEPGIWSVICPRQTIREDLAADCHLFANILFDITMWCWVPAHLNTELP